MRMCGSHLIPRTQFCDDFCDMCRRWWCAFAAVKSCTNSFNNLSPVFMASGSNQDLAQSQLSATDKNVSIESQVKNLVTGLQSQDMFSNSTPVRSKLKDNRRLKQTNKTKRQAHVFAPGQEADNSINQVPVQVIEHNDDLPQSGQQLLTTSGTSTDDSSNNNDDAIVNLLQQFINSTRNNENGKTERAKIELKELYINQMRKRDRAQRNLENINAAKLKPVECRMACKSKWCQRYPIINRLFSNINGQSP